MLVPFARTRARAEAELAERTAAAAAVAEERRLRVVAAYERADARARKRARGRLRTVVDEALSPGCEPSSAACDDADVTAELDGPGVRDQQTVTPDGESTRPVIDGVLMRAPITHLDHRGALFEIYDGDPATWPDPVVYAYQTSVLPGQIKGWARHEVKKDRYTITAGELLVLLHDPRPDSPTCGVSQSIVLSPRGVRQLVIPVEVWHMIINLRAEEAQLINLPTEPYHHANPDRILLPWDTDEIPVDVRSYLPKF